MCERGETSNNGNFVAKDLTSTSQQTQVYTCHSDCQLQFIAAPYTRYCILSHIGYATYSINFSIIVGSIPSTKITVHLDIVSYLLERVMMSFWSNPYC